MTEPTHLAFSDETCFNIGRYRGISAVSFPMKNYEGLNAEIKEILIRNHIKELKWQKLNADIDYQASLDFINFAVKYALGQIIRIDTLVWDINDSRHKLRGRDDLANMHKMYSYLYKNILSKRWPIGSTWYLRADEQSSIDWREINRLIDAARISVGPVEPISGLVETFTTEFEVTNIEPCHSETQPFIQLADLFGGIAIYSRNKYEYFEHWKRNCQDYLQPVFPNLEFPSIKLSNADRRRCPLLHELNKMCKKARLGVGLESSRGLRTYKPTYPINFWWYEPQSENDKAPQRC